MKSGTVVVVVIAGAAALYLFAKNKAMAAQPGFTSLGNAGGVAHSPDITTGGALSVLGSLAPSLSSWFGGGSSSPASVPSDQYSPGLGSSTISNPVYPSPSVLPYSYKQQNIDTPSLLDTNSLFTPSTDGGGSSGSYSDDGNDDIYGSDAGF
jgi:hypothetical protein